MIASARSGGSFAISSATPQPWRQSSGASLKRASQRSISSWSGTGTAAGAPEPSISARAPAGPESASEAGVPAAFGLSAAATELPSGIDIAGGDAGSAENPSYANHATAATEIDAAPARSTPFDMTRPPIVALSASADAPAAAAGEKPAACSTSPRI